MIKLALIGRDLSYSKSDIMHGFILKKLSIKLKYDMISIPNSNDLADNLAYIFKNYHGFNITIPYKESIIPHITALSGDAEIYKSVNTVTCKNKVGYNTDGLGFMMMLGSESVCVKGKSVLVLGSGGAAKSCVYKLVQAGAAVDVYNRTYSKAESLFKLYGGFSPLKELIDKRYDIIVNTTSVGMLSTISELPAPKEIVEKAETLVDLIYNPKITKFLEVGLKNGKKIVNGEKMLFFQAYFADMYFLEKTADINQAIDFYNEFNKTFKGRL